MLPRKSCAVVSAQMSSMTQITAGTVGRSVPLAYATTGRAHLRAALVRHVPHSCPVAQVDLVSAPAPPEALGSVSMVQHHARASQIAAPTPIVHPVRFAQLIAVASGTFASGRHSVVATHCAFVIGSTRQCVVILLTQPSAIRAFGRIKGNAMKRQIEKYHKLRDSLSFCGLNDD